MTSESIDFYRKSEDINTLCDVIIAPSRENC